MKKTKNNLKTKIIISLVLIALLLVSFLFETQIESFLNLKSSSSSHQTTSANIESSNYYVSYINVGQGNSTYVKLPDGKNVLIDGGDSEYGETVSKFLKNHNVSTIDYMIATHADSDHIGGLNYILNNFEVKNVLRPFQIAGTGASAAEFVVYEYEQLGGVYADLATSADKKMSRITTEVYKNFIKNIYTEKYSVGDSNADCKVTVFYDGLKISDTNYEIEFFAPLKRDDNIVLESYAGSTTYGYATVGYGTSSGSSNDNSAIFTISCYDDRYLFMGDARYTESTSTELDYSEGDFINSLTNTEKEWFKDVDVLLVAHHGSKYSTSTELLDIIQPRFVVISVGENNKYEHPADETLARIATVSSLETDYLVRTDKNGDIEFSSVNGNLMFSLETQEAEKQLEISYKLLSTTIVAVIILSMFAIRPKRARRSHR